MRGLLRTTYGLIVSGVILLSGFTVNAATPTDTEVAKLLANDPSIGDLFGWSVAVDGNTAVIGAVLDDDNGPESGSAYVFTRQAGVWTLQQKLTASDGSIYEEFGSSVAVDGDTIVIGAINALYDDENSSGPGSAYVFTRTEGVWTEQAKLIASDGAAEDFFGISVAISGDTAMIGAFGDDDNGVDSGSAYVFSRLTGIWSEQAKLKAYDEVEADGFGFSVAVAGDSAVIGAPGANASYVFNRNAGVWIQQVKLSASDGAVGDFFGISVAVDSDTAVIGAFGDSDNGFGTGSAYVFTSTQGVWTEQAKLTASDGAAEDYFGFSVALDGNTAVIGTYGDDDNGMDSGSAYVFTRREGVWRESLKLLASDGSPGNNLGAYYPGVAVSGTTVIAGAPYHSLSDTQPATGAAYVFSIITDTQGPITTNVFADPNPVLAFTSLDIGATLDDSTTDGSTITSASFTTNGGFSTPMAASDGVYDSVTENVTATITGGLATGVYNICVFGTDSADNTGAQNCTLLAVYNPNAGFITGGGWIDSPPGAYLVDPTVTGKIHFGFNAKYLNGQSEPQGNTQLQFQIGELKFHSTSYEWLVIADAKTTFKGVGTINGQGNYGFMLTAIDAALAPSTAVDLLRIKIWDKDKGDVVYDNGLGSADTADPVSAISGGSIVIHDQ